MKVSAASHKENRSLWQDSVKGKEPHYPTLEESIETDVLVIGGGIAGVLCARRLQDIGARVVLVEGKTLGHGATGNTSAKVSAQHGAHYSMLLQKEGVDKARLYYDAQTEGLNTIRAMASEFDCDFEDKTAFIYSQENHDKLEQEAQAYEKLSIPQTYGVVNLPDGEARVLGMPYQGQFNPVKFLYGASKGIEIYENTTVTDIHKNVAETEKGIITAQFIVLATHYPLVNVPGFYFLKLNQERSYLLALENAPDVDGMYIGIDAKPFSYRNYRDLLLVGGGNHQTGKEGGQYRELRDLVNSQLPQAREVSAWATQDCMSLDSMPYVGVHHEGNEHLLVTSAFNKWGMTGSMAAAQIITDHIGGRENKYAELFLPSRNILKGTIFDHTKESLKGYFHWSKRCTHLGCALHHNEAEHSWDCPCHGSRFAETGQILDGPAKHPL